MKIISITTSSNPTMIFGLGDDNKVYLWSATLGGWLPNWNQKNEKP